MARRTKRSVVQSLYSSQICSSVQNSNLKHNNTHPHGDGCKSVPEADGPATGDMDTRSLKFRDSLCLRGRGAAIVITQPLAATLTRWHAAGGIEGMSPPALIS